MTDKSTLELHLIPSVSHSIGTICPTLTWEWSVKLLSSDSSI